MSGKFLFGSRESGGKGENCSSSFLLQFVTEVWDCVQFPRMQRNEEKYDISYINFPVILIANLLRRENLLKLWRNGGKQRKLLK